MTFGKQSSLVDPPTDLSMVNGHAQTDERTTYQARMREPVVRFAKCTLLQLFDVVEGTARAAFDVSLPHRDVQGVAAARTGAKVGLLRR